MRLFHVSAVASLTLLAGTALAATFGPGNLVVSQYGTGSGALGSGGTAIVLREFTTAGSSVQSVNMPTTGSGANRRFVGSGTAGSEGALTLSTDGRYLTMTGYDANVGTASVASAAGIDRVVARIDWDSNIDTSTAFTQANGFSGNNFRSAVSTDGSGYWVGGAGAGTSGGGAGGVRYIPHGGSATVGLTANGTGTLTNARVVNIFNGQLYASTQSGTFVGVNSIGTGLPTTGPVSASNLATTAIASANQYDFFFASSTVLYVADERGTGTGGLQKFVFNGTSWVSQFNVLVGGNVGIRGLTGSVDALGNVQLYAVTNEATANRLVSFTDTLASTTFSGTTSTLATAGANTLFRGVDFAPVPTPGSMALLGLAGVVAARRRRA